jgi:hypothetical protein
VTRSDDEIRADLDARASEEPPVWYSAGSRLADDARDLLARAVAAEAEVERLRCDAVEQRGRFGKIRAEYEAELADARHFEREYTDLTEKYETLRAAVAKVQEACERKFFNVRRGLHDDEGTWPVVRVEDVVAALAGAAPKEVDER